MSKYAALKPKLLRLVSTQASIREMAAALQVGHGTVQDLLAELAADGYITKPDGPIRKARMRHLTEKGRQALGNQTALEGRT